MFEEIILEVISKIVMFLLPAYLIYTLLKELYRFAKNRVNQTSFLKYMFCMMIIVSIITSTFIIMSLQIYQVAVIFEESELEATVKDQVLSLAFTCIEFINSLIAIVLSSFILKNFYYKQIIPGEGTIRKRLVDMYKGFMKNLRYINEGRN